MLNFKFVMVGLIIGLPSLLEAAPESDQISIISESYERGTPNQMLLAQKNKARGGGRRKFITGEGRTQGSSTAIDFDAAAIEGERRAPAGVTVGGNKQDHGYDLINLRLKWHSEMVQSTKNLETGRGQ